MDKMVYTSMTGREPISMHGEHTSVQHPCSICGAETYLDGREVRLKVCTENPTHVVHLTWN